MNLATSADNTASSIIAVVLIIIGLVGYWVPSIVVLLRRAPNWAQVLVVNVFLGWTVIGWIVALVMALKPKPRPVSYPPYGPPPQYINYRPQ